MSRVDRYLQLRRHLAGEHCRVSHAAALAVLEAMGALALAMTPDERAELRGVRS